jgi:acetyl-CoA synthetase
MDEKNEIEGNQVGSLCIKYPWPGIARTIWVIISVINVFYCLSGKYFTGDGALRDEVGYYRITGRVDDVVIVSGHNLEPLPLKMLLTSIRQLLSQL